MVCVTNAPPGDTVEKLRRMLLKGAVASSNVMKDLAERSAPGHRLYSRPVQRCSASSVSGSSLPMRLGILTICEVDVENCSVAGSFSIVPSTPRA